MTREEKVIKVTKQISEGGWSSLYSLVDRLSDDELDAYTWDEEEEDDE